MNHYQQSLIVKASPSVIYSVLTTSQGMRSWWTQDCDVGTKIGDLIRVRFGGTHKEMCIELLEPNREVRWLCSGAHINLDWLTRKDEWVGTQIAFHLTAEGDGNTRLDFEHIGLVPSFECYDLCDNGWRYFLNSLQQFAETGAGTPYESGDNCEHKSEVRSL
jgi:uncharacterized protein YndB with AHSA1/START domain